MNKLTVIVLVAAAFAQEKCATAKELVQSDFAEYKLKYKLTSDYKQNEDLTKATSIGFDSTDEKTCGPNYCYIQTGRDTTFKIEGVPATNDNPDSFRIYSQDEKKVFSWNQGPNFSGDGYYMFEVDKEYISGPDYYYYTLLTYNGTHKELNFIRSDNTFDPLQVYERTKANGTVIYRRGSPYLEPGAATKFCFVKVKQPTALKCPIDDLVSALKQLDAKVTGETCVAGADIESGKSCEAQCNSPKTENPVTCTCDDGTWKVKVAALKCRATCKVDDLVSKLSKLDAEIKDVTCEGGADIESGKVCKTSCKSSKKGPDVIYICSDRTWKAPEDMKCLTKKSEKTCKVDDFVTELKKLNAKFTEPKCTAGSTIKENDKCEVSCKSPGKRDKLKYTCGDDGNFTAPDAKDIACTSNFAQFGVFGALICSFALN